MQHRMPEKMAPYVIRYEFITKTVPKHERREGMPIRYPQIRTVHYSVGDLWLNSYENELDWSDIFRIYKKIHSGAVKGVAAKATRKFLRLMAKHS